MLYFYAGSTPECTTPPIGITVQPGRFLPANRQSSQDAVYFGKNSRSGLAGGPSSETPHIEILEHFSTTVVGKRPLWADSNALKLTKNKTVGRRKLLVVAGFV